MFFSQLLKPDRVFIDNASQSKTAVLRRISQLFCEAPYPLEPQSLFKAYWERESLGSTAIGNGIIIPHIHLPELTEAKACFIKLTHPVDFKATDKQPADLVIGLLSPGNQCAQHLTILSAIVQQFSCQDFCKACRKTNDCLALYKLITEVSSLAYS